MIRVHKKCYKCNRDISLSNYDKHINSCLNNNKKRILLSELWKQNNGKYKCPYCEKEFCKKGICSHIWRIHEDGKNFKVKVNLGRTVWNKGLTKEIDERVKINSENSAKTIKKLVKEGKWKKRNVSKDHYINVSIRQSLKNSGGRCKWFEINGQNVQGTWERDFALLMNKLNIKWIKIKNYTDSFIYFKDNKIKRYTPDFYLEEIDKYIEIKGFWWGNDKDKMKLVFENNFELKTKLIIIEKYLYKKILNVNSKNELLNLLK